MLVSNAVKCGIRDGNELYLITNRLVTIRRNTFLSILSADTRGVQKCMGK